MSVPVPTHRSHRSASCDRAGQHRAGGVPAPLRRHPRPRRLQGHLDRPARALCQAPPGAPRALHLGRVRVGQGGAAGQRRRRGGADRATPRPRAAHDHGGLHRLAAALHRAGRKRPPVHRLRAGARSIGQRRMETQLTFQQTHTHHTYLPTYATLNPRR